MFIASVSAVSTWPGRGKGEMGAVKLDIPSLNTVCGLRVGAIWQAQRDGGWVSTCLPELKDFTALTGKDFHCSP